MLCMDFTLPHLNFIPLLIQVFLYQGHCLVCWTQKQTQAWDLIFTTHWTACCRHLQLKTWHIGWASVGMCCLHPKAAKQRKDQKFKRGMKNKVEILFKIFCLRNWMCRGVWISKEFTFFTFKIKNIFFNWRLCPCEVLLTPLVLNMDPSFLIKSSDNPFGWGVHSDIECFHIFTWSSSAWLGCYCFGTLMLTCFCFGILT